METNKTHTADKYSPYPGEYKSSFLNWNEIMTELRKPPKKTCKTSSNIRELPDHYQVEIIAPGHCKEDFIVDIDKNILSVVAIQSSLFIEQRHYHLHEFNFEYLISLKLPGNIDVDFASARYYSGILSIHLPKTAHPTLNKAHHIIVY